MRVASQAISFTLLLLTLAISGCNSERVKHYRLNQLAKSDIDYVSDTAASTVRQLLDDLTVKLYKRNPRELKKVSGTTIESRLQQLAHTTDYRFIELNEMTGEAAVNLAFSESFEGDRVFALMVGLTSMLHAAYNHQFEFYMLDTLDEQKLYNSARNVEILVWRLSQRRNSQGGLYLLTNSQADEVANLSFERLFGKVIAIQDMMAEVTASKTDRTISKVVISVAQSAFLPVGL